MKEKIPPLTFEECEFNDILNNTLGLIQSAAVFFKHNWPTIRQDADDLVNEGVLVLFKCIKMYRKERGRFRGYLVMSLRHRFLDIARKENIVIFDKDWGNKIEVSEQLASYNYYNQNVPPNPPVPLNGLSKKAKLFISIVLKTPNDLAAWMTSRRGMPYQYCIGHYLKMNPREVNEIKNELITKLL